MGVICLIIGGQTDRFPETGLRGERTLDASATSLKEPMDQFYGDRSGGVQDLCGNHWHIATHKEDVPPEELARCAEAFMKQQ